MAAAQVTGGATVGHAGGQAQGYGERNAANGYAGTDANDALSAQTVIPAIPNPGARGLGDRARDVVTVRDFLMKPACDGVTDDSAAVAYVATQMRGTGRKILVPSDCRLLLGNGAQVWLSGMGFYSEGIRDNGRASPTGYGQQGGTFLLTSTTQSPFVVSTGWSLKGLVFDWPAQTEAAAAANGGNPVAFPPLIATHGTDQATFWSFDDNQVENAYDVINLTNAAGVGHFHFQGNLDFALRYHFVLSSAGGETFVTDNQFSPAAYSYGVLGFSTTYLRDFAATNAEILHITGNGTTTAVAGTAVEGMRLSGNYGFVLRYGIHAVGGTFSLGTLVSDSFDQVQTAIGADSGGLIGSTTVTGGTWLCQRLGNAAATAPCININGGAPGNSLTLANVQIPVTVGAGVVFDDTAPSGSNLPPNLTIIGGSILNVGQIATGNPFNGVNFIAPNGSLTIVGTAISTTATQNSAAQGVVIGGAKTSVIAGVTMGGFSVPFVYNTLAGTHSVTGSTSYGSTSPIATPPIQGAGAALVTTGGNNFDIGSANLAVRVLAGQTGGLSVSGPDTNVDIRLTTQAAGRMVVQSSLGPIFIAQAYGSAAQTAYPILQSAPAGQNAALTASTGNLLITAPNYLLVPTVNLPPCAIGPAGYLCAVSTAAGSAVQTK